MTLILLVQADYVLFKSRMRCRVVFFSSPSPRYRFIFDINLSLVNSTLATTDDLQAPLDDVHK